MLPLKLLLATVTLGLPLSACGAATTAQPAMLGTATLNSPIGQPTGTAVLQHANDRLELTIMVSGLTPDQRHGIHLHANGACQAPAFTTAGPHLNPSMRQHGLDNPMGSHLGDLPNLIANANGVAQLTTVLPGDPAVTLGQLFDQDGSALVIHTTADDMRTDPSGNSGARIACGVLLPGNR